MHLLFYSYISYFLWICIQRFSTKYSEHFANAKDIQTTCNLIINLFAEKNWWKIVLMLYDRVACNVALKHVVLQNVCFFCALETYMDLLQTIRTISKFIHSGYTLLYRIQRHTSTRLPSNRKHEYWIPHLKCMWVLCVSVIVSTFKVE